MKALEILTPIQLKSDIELPSGSIVLVSETYQNATELFEGEAKEKFVPSRIGVLAYASKEALQKESQPIQGTDFANTFNDFAVTVDDYYNTGIGTLSINYVKEKLEMLYPAKIQIIDL